MSTIKSSAENLTLNADGANNDIKFQSNGSEVAQIDQAGVISSTGGSTHADNVKAKFGTGGDLEVYHDGSNSYISDTGATGLIIKNDALQFARGGNTEKYLEATANGSVDLYHNNNKKFETTATGVTVTGAIAGATNLGKVLQVVNATYSTTVVMSSQTYADTGLTAAITPSSTSSKILVVVNQQGLKTGNNHANNDIGVQLLRGSSVINLIGKEYGFTGSTQYMHIATVSTSYLDSPSSTSAVTYKTQFANNDGGSFGGTVYAQSANPASTMTLMEIAG